MNVQDGHFPNMINQADKSHGPLKSFNAPEAVNPVGCFGVIKKREKIGRNEVSCIRDQDDMTPRPLRISKRIKNHTPSTSALSSSSTPAKHEENTVPERRLSHNTPQVSAQHERLNPSRINGKRLEKVEGFKEVEYFETIGETRGTQNKDGKVPVLGVRIPQTNRGCLQARAPAFIGTRHNSIDFTASAHRANSAGPDRSQPGVRRLNATAKEHFSSHSRTLSNPIIKEPHHTPGVRTRSVTADIGHLQKARITPRGEASIASKNSQSFKQRLLSRVMDGLTISTSVTQISKKDGRSRASTSSSSDGSTTINSDLGDTLATFPSPPTTALTSPTSVETPPNEPCVIDLPPVMAIAGVQLELKPDAIAVPCDGYQNISIAIQIKGEGFPVNLAHPFTIPRRLDVAVVIDNSLFTSPATLMAQCETTRFLASQLDYHNDRLAVLCTRPLTTKTGEPNVVAPLSPWTIRAAKVVTDSIVSIAHKPEPAALSMALDSAIDVLAHSAPRTDKDRHFTKTFGHIFVLSPNGNGLSRSLINHEYLQIHFIEAGILGWMNTSPACNGWTLRSSFPNKLPWMLGQSESDPDSLFDRLRSLVSFSRIGRVFGQITDLTLNVEPGPNTSIERVMGQRHFVSVRPGELVTVWASVRVRAVSKKPASSQSNGSRPPTSDDLLEELDVMLGSDDEPLLTAKLSYKHSLLPSATSCELSGTARIRRQPVESQWGGLSSRSVLLEANMARVSVQKVMIFHLARHGDPRKALPYLRGRFGETGEHSICFEYFMLITNELAYQSRIVERFDLSVHGQDSGKTSVESRSIANYTFEHFGEGLLEATNFKPQHWLTDAHCEISGDLPPPLPPLKGQESHFRLNDRYGSQRQASDLSQCSSKDSIDFCTRIWSDIRRLKRPIGIATRASENTTLQKLS